MMKYKLSKKALNDLEDIRLFTFENWSVEQADRYFNLLVVSVSIMVND